MIVTSDFKCYFTEKTEEIDSGLDNLEEEWELSKPDTIKYDAKQLKILFSLCQLIGKGDQFPVLNQGATEVEVDDFVDHAQGILAGALIIGMKNMLMMLLVLYLMMEPIMRIFLKSIWTMPF